MPRPPAAKPAITQAARAEFRERGYGAASIRTIAERAGVSLSAMYHYYEGKQALLSALIRESTEQYFAAIEDALAHAGDSAAERLAAAVGATVRFRAEYSLSSSLQQESRSLEGDNLAWYLEQEERGTRLFGGLIAGGIASGEFHTAHADDARRAIIAMTTAISQWYDPSGRRRLDDIEAAYVALALRIVEHRGERPPRQAKSLGRRQPTRSRTAARP